MLPLCLPFAFPFLRLKAISIAFLLPKYLGEIYQRLRRVAGSGDILRDFGSLETFVSSALAL